MDSHMTDERMDWWFAIALTLYVMCSHGVAVAHERTHVRCARDTRSLYVARFGSALGCSHVVVSLYTPRTDHASHYRATRWRCRAMERCESLLVDSMALHPPHTLARLHRPHHPRAHAMHRHTANDAVRRELLWSLRDRPAPARSRRRQVRLCLSCTCPSAMSFRCKSCACTRPFAHGPTRTTRRARVCVRAAESSDARAFGHSTSQALVATTQSTR